MMEAAGTSETSVNQTTWISNPQDCHLHCVVTFVAFTEEGSQI
jgi:hypothetical protein